MANDLPIELAQRATSLGEDAHALAEDAFAAGRRAMAEELLAYLAALGRDTETRFAELSEAEVAVLEVAFEDSPPSSIAAAHYGAIGHALALIELELRRRLVGDPPKPSS